MKHILRAIVGPQAGEVIVLRRRTTLGRAADCDIQIVHEGVSRHHAKLSVSDDAVTLTDLSSDNGTYVNGERIGRHTLQPGDSVRVLQSHFLYEALEDEYPIATSAAYERKVTSGDSLRRTGPVEIMPRPKSGAMSTAPKAPPLPPPGPPAGPRSTPAPAQPASPSPSRTAVRSTPNLGVPLPPTASRGAAPDHASESSPGYAAGSSGMWRRSVEPATRRRTAATGPASAATVALSDEVGDAAEWSPSPTPNVPLRAPSDATPHREAPRSEPPPVTTGSGAFRRPVDPNRRRSPEAPVGFARAADSGRGWGLEVGPSNGPSTGRFATGELRAANLDESELRVPPAARGGSATVPTRARPTAEVPHEPTMASDDTSDSRYSTSEYGRIGGGPSDAAAERDLPEHHAGPDTPVTSRRDPRAEPTGPTDAATPNLPDGWAPARRSGNAIDAVGPAASRFRAPGVATDRHEPVPPPGRPTPTSLRTAERPIAETGEYPEPGSRQTGEYGLIPEVRLDREGEVPAVDERALAALSSALGRRTGGADEPLPPPSEGEGKVALVAVLQYRDFRLRTLQGGRLTAVERRRYDHLDRYLQRVDPGGSVAAAKRRFARFSCELPAELTYAHVRGMSTIAVAVYDLGAGGAKLDVGSTELTVGDFAWLSIDLADVPDVPVPSARTVVFKSRIVWVETAQLGLAFAGAPQYDAKPSAG